jgi:hypothetical protein
LKKKNQKNFCSPSGVGGTGGATHAGIKVFFFFFVHKKEDSSLN